MKMYVHLEKIGGRHSRRLRTALFLICFTLSLSLSFSLVLTHTHTRTNTVSLFEYPKLSKFMCVICFITLDCGTNRRIDVEIMMRKICCLPRFSSLLLFLLLYIFIGRCVENSNFCDYCPHKSIVRRLK